MITLFYKLKTYPTEAHHKADKKSKFGIYLNNEFIGLVNSPAYDGARLILKMGYSPDILMTTQSIDSEYPSWKPQTIAKFAKLTVWENDTRFRVTDYSTYPIESFREWRGEGVKVGESEFQVSTYLIDKRGLKTALSEGLQ